MIIYKNGFSVSRLGFLTFMAVSVFLIPRLDIEAQEYTPPQTSDGQPDLQGVWQAMNTAVWNIQDHSAAYGVPAGQGVVVGDEIHYRSWALEQRKENFRNRFADR